MSGSKNRQPRGNASKSQDEAITIARATQKPGQNKEQTRLIAQGIQKGIEQYKKQHKARLRELDKQQKQQSRKALAQQQASESKGEIQERVIYKQHWLPWGLLLISWAGFISYLALKL